MEMIKKIDHIFSLERSLNVVSLDESGRPYILSPAIYDFLLAVYFGMFQKRPFHAKEIIHLMTKKNGFFSSGAIEKAGSKYAQSRFLSELVKNGSNEDSYNYVYNIQSSDFCKRAEIENDIPKSTGKELLYYLSGEGYLALEILIHLPWRFFEHTNIYFQQSLKNNKQVSIKGLEERSNFISKIPNRYRPGKGNDPDTFIWQDLKDDIEDLLGCDSDLFYRVFSKEFGSFRCKILLNELMKTKITSAEKKASFFKIMEGSKKVNEWDHKKIFGNLEKISEINNLMDYFKADEKLNKVIKRYERKKDYFLELI